MDGEESVVLEAGQEGGGGRVRLAAVGDLLLPVDPRGEEGPRDVSSLFAGPKSVFDDCDLVFGNFECTLEGGGERVSTEPRVISTPELISCVKEGGFDIVTLANNHAFDCLLEGFHRMRGELDEMGIVHFGAGDNLEEAVEPVVMEAGGVRLGFICGVDRGTGPNIFAGPGQFGVAALDMDRMAEQIGRLSSQVDHVIVSVHWGDERFLVPSPGQIEQGHAMVEAGASLVLGHHPHVLQGMETYRGAPIIYSLGNFIASEVYFTDGDRVSWNRRERTGCIMVVEMDRQEVLSVKQVPTYDTGERIEVDGSVYGRKCIAGVNRKIRGGVTLRRYRWEHLRVQTLKPMLGYLKWSKLKTLRFRQVKKALFGVFRAAKVGEEGES